MNTSPLNHIRSLNLTPSQLRYRASRLREEAASRFCLLKLNATQSADLMDAEADCLEAREAFAKRGPRKLTNGSRSCTYCEEPLEQRGRESNETFEVRKFCNRSCAGKYRQLLKKEMR